jgi:hypothetical protein
VGAGGRGGRLGPFAASRRAGQRRVHTSALTTMTARTVSGRKHARAHTHTHTHAHTHTHTHTLTHTRARARAQTPAPALPHACARARRSPEPRERERAHAHGAGLVGRQEDGLARRRRALQLPEVAVDGFGGHGRRVGGFGGLVVDGFGRGAAKLRMGLARGLGKAESVGRQGRTRPAQPWRAHWRRGAPARAHGPASAVAGSQGREGGAHC